MTVRVRSFGVRDLDLYWQDRRKQATTGETRLHRFLAGLVDELAQPGSQILECGPGEGYVLRRCSQRHHVHAVEYSAEAIRGYDFPLASLHQADLNDGIPDYDVLFHVILASCVLHWLDRPADFLQQARELLAPGGRLVINIPNITHVKYRIQFLFGRFPQISLSHKNFQTPREFETMARRCGFRIERRLVPRIDPHVRWLPTLFSHDLIYILKPE